MFYKSFSNIATAILSCLSFSLLEAISKTFTITIVGRAITIERVIGKEAIGMNVQNWCKKIKQIVKEREKFISKSWKSDT